MWFNRLIGNSAGKLLYVTQIPALFFFLLVLIFPIGDAMTNETILQNIGEPPADNGRQKGGGTTTIILLGASYAQGFGVKDFPGLIIINKGIGGQQSFELLNRFERDVIDLKPAKVIIWGFINDFFRSSPGKTTETVTRIKESFNEMVRLSRENGIIPVLASEITMGPRDGLKERVLGIVAKLMGKTSYQERISMQVQDINLWMKDYASDQKILFLDFQRLLAEEKGLMRKREYTQEDGSHVTEEGYRVLYQFIEDNALLLK